MSSYFFEANSIGRNVLYADNPQANLRSVLETNTLYNKRDKHNPWGEPVPTERSVASLDCCPKKPMRLQYRWQSTPGNPCEPGGMNRFSPEELQWESGSMGIPRAYARFDRPEHQHGWVNEPEFRHSINYYERA
jgi:hypothetical protein